MNGLPVKILFVCSRNRWRSPTAERLFDGVPGVQARSAGTEASARVRVSEKLLGWADVIFCMERRHVQRLRERFAVALDDKEIHILDVPDDYEYMNPELIEALRTALGRIQPSANRLKTKKGAARRAVPFL